MSDLLKQLGGISRIKGVGPVHLLVLAFGHSIVGTLSNSQEYTDAIAAHLAEIVPPGTAERESQAAEPNSPWGLQMQQLLSGGEPAEILAAEADDDKYLYLKDVNIDTSIDAPSIRIERAHVETYAILPRPRTEHRQGG